MYNPVHFSMGKRRHYNVYKIYIRYALSGVVSKYISCDSITGVYEYIGYVCANSIEQITQVDYYKYEEESK